VNTDDMIVDCIMRGHRADGCPPTVAEIAATVGRSETAVRRRLARLQDEGRVDWNPGRHRSLRTTNLKADTVPM
jgi:DNA-binding GntR family transcriptional regulator